MFLDLGRAALLCLTISSVGGDRLPVVDFERNIRRCLQHIFFLQNNRSRSMKIDLLTQTSKWVKLERIARKPELPSTRRAGSNDVQDHIGVGYWLAYHVSAALKSVGVGAVWIDRKESGTPTWPGAITICRSQCSKSRCSCLELLTMNQH